MKVWAIADLHLPFGDPAKSMAIFGPQWESYTDKIEKNWKECISGDDLVLIAGDISWAMRLEQAVIDLEWIDRLPGTKVMIRGNHDYWWSSAGKVRAVLPPSIQILQNDVFNFGAFSIAGSRLWDTKEFSFGGLYQENPKAAVTEDPEAQKIFQRELIRLEMSLKELDPTRHRIAMTHYPPVGVNMEESQASKLLEKYGVEVCVFGHLHNLRPSLQLFGNKRGVNYFLTSCDYLNFKPIVVFENVKL